jgi:hypothetical protein
MPNYITGSDGNCSLGSDNKAQFNTWSATVTRTVHDVTGFGDEGRRRILGLLDITGSAGGVPISNDSSTAPDAGGSSTGAVGLQALGSTGGNITLTFDNTNASNWVFAAVIDSIAATSTMGGDSTITFNFQMSGGARLTETWDETS